MKFKLMFLAALTAVAVPFALHSTEPKPLPAIVEEVVEQQMALTREAGLTESALLQRFQQLQPEDVINLSS